MNAATDKIKMMKGSIRCLVYGLLGLLPVFGVPFALMALANREHPHVFFWECLVISIFSMIGFPVAVVALISSAQAYAKEKLYWNAARPFRILGGVSAVIGLIASFIVVVLIVFTILNLG